MPSDPTVAVGELENCVPTPQPPATLIDPVTPTIFHEPWWLDIATEGRCVVAETRSNGKIVGRLPYSVEKSAGFSIFRMPTLTHILGPAVDPGEGNVSARFLKRLTITRELISQLPPLSLFKVICHRGVTDVIAFQEEGFRTSVQFTHEIQPRSIEETWQKMRDKTRNCIRRAQEALKIVKIEDPYQFISFYANSLKGKKISSNINLKVARALITESLSRHRGRIIGAADKDGKLVAAVFYVWDETSYFYNMSMREESSDKGAISMLIWEAIQDASNRNLIFDFDGLSSKGSSRFYASFGGIATPRYVALRATPLFRILHECRTLIHDENAFLGPNSW
jgi:hypothetical protein